MRQLSRRHFLKTIGIVSLGFLGLRRYAASAPPVQTGAGYGALVPDSAGVIDLPPGFRYQVFSRTGERMTDGLFVPGAHDGMAAFAGPGGRTLLVRNHELTWDNSEAGPFDAGNRMLGQVPSNRLYDSAPALGGTTTLVFDSRTSQLEQHYLSLGGTVRNCAGGPTPWDTWVSCEETMQNPDDHHRERHGYNFEVPASGIGLAMPVPLKAMGRFNHEAVAVETATGIVYQSEDRDDSLFYRFIPDRPGNLTAGGRLQALVIRGMEGVDTSNRRTRTIRDGQRLDVDWIELEDVDPIEDTLRIEGFAKGAAQFARGEGIWADGSVIYLACTAGGANECGQIWRYRTDVQQLELFVEPNDNRVLENVDNITVAPWGDLVLCEDGQGDNLLVGVTPGGNLYRLGRNAMNDSEFAGATFSPDASTLFVNIQRPGLTLAITGPW